ncbi:MAG TPA: ankyrin repeat domain-containing protein [Rhodospirillaceae bacterium]|nr:ankyrin repeat domain-containing protein [Rhodospirillaceae bacterium]
MTKTFLQTSWRPAILCLFALVGVGAMSSKTGFAQTNILADDPLIVAVYEDRVERVRELLVRKHPKSRADTDGRTALIWGSIQGSYQSIELLLEDKVLVNNTDAIGNGALYHAAENGHIEVVELLLSYRAPINQENRDGRTPLMAAVRAGHIPVVQFLIDAGADPTISDFTGRTALDLAREGRSRQVTGILEKVGTR